MKDLDGMKLLLAVPTYGPADPRCQAQLRGSIMLTANHGVTWVGDISTDRANFSSARNLAAQVLYSSDEANGLVFIDSDIRHSPEDLGNLLLMVKEYGMDFATGVYHQRAKPYISVIFHWSPETKLWKPMAKYPQNTVFKADGCGFGFVYLSKNAVRRVAENHEFDEEYGGWFPDKRTSDGYGEDLSFCYMAMKSGIQLYVNSNVIVGHLGDPEVIHPSTHPVPDDYDAVKQPTQKWGEKYEL